MNQVRDVSVWFNDKVWTYRLLYAVGFQSLMVYLITLGSLILLQLNVFHPIDTIVGAISVPFSWKSWLVSFIAAIIVIPSTGIMAYIMTPRNQTFRAHYLHGGWRLIGLVILWIVLQLLVDVIIALCCLSLAAIHQRSTGVVCYGIIVSSLSSSVHYFWQRRFRFEFPADVDFSKYKNRIRYFYDKSFRSRTRSNVRFVTLVLAITVISFILFGWYLCRFFSKYPSSFIEAVWHVLICQPSVIWSIGVLSLAVICRQNSCKAFIDLFICQARLLKLLMDEGVDINAVDRFGKTALMHAATLGARAATQTLLRHERLNATLADYFGNTSLMLACSAGHDIVSLLLLEHLKRANGLEAVLLYLDAQNNNGDTAMTLAIKNGHVECANLLSEYLKPYQFILPSSDPLPMGQAMGYFYTLGEALAVDQPSILKYLAFLDLRQLTLQRQPRMQQIFTVSRPGGHPRTWVSIVSPMLLALQNQIKMFQDINERLAAAWEFKIEQATAGRGLIIGGSRVATSIQPKHWNRDWKLNNEFDSVKTAQLNGDYRPVAITFERMLSDYLPGFITNLWAVSPLAGDDALWADLTLQLWNIEAFGHIIASSYTDDQYGVVQRDLPAVIGHLLDLYSASDRYARLVTSQRVNRRQKSEMDLHLTSLRDCLTETMEEISNVFRNLSDIRLTDQQRILLKRLTERNGFLK